MKKLISGKWYDTDECHQIASSEELYCRKYLGHNFDYASLCVTPEGHFFLHGKGPLGCNTIIDMTLFQATYWVLEACDYDRDRLSKTIKREWILNAFHLKEFRDLLGFAKEPSAPAVCLGHFQSPL